MTTPTPLLPDDVWTQITDRLNAADLNALMSVDKHLHDRLRENPRAWRTHLNDCSDAQLQRIGQTIPTLAAPVDHLLKLRTMTTLAGTGQLGFDGDGGPAREAKLNCPESVAIGRDGTVYVADMANHCVRRIALDGVITTLAGVGQPGYSGDNGPAHQATLHSPHGVTVGLDGTVYIADTFNHCIRRVAVDGTITTHAGTGRPGDGGDNGPADQAALNSPHGLALGPGGSLYIADTCNNRIRRVGSNNTIT
ncbi:hypothetical protein AB0885_36920, partial [Streptomyces sp. NPDC005534]